MGDLASSTTFQVPPRPRASASRSSRRRLLPPFKKLLSIHFRNSSFLFVGGFVMSFVFVAKAVRGPSPSTYNTYQLGRLRTS